MMPKDEVLKKWKLLRDNYKVALLLFWMGNDEFKDMFVPDYELIVSTIELLEGGKNEW